MIHAHEGLFCRYTRGAFFFTTGARLSELGIAGMHPAQVLITTHAEIPRLVGVFA